MKLVIDIPDELYNDIIDHRIFAPNGVYSCIENGTPVKTGEWIDLDNVVEVYDNWYECSVCGKESFDYDFCPNCGVRMKGGAEE